MARAVSNRQKSINTAIGWAVALLLFFPILWTILTSFKPERIAVATPPVFFDFDWTLKNYFDVERQRSYFSYFLNSVIISFGSTIIGIVIAIPAAWSMAFFPARRTKDLLMWMLSTKMMPAVGVVVPLFLIFKTTGYLDSRAGLIVVLMLINLPIIIWMLYTYFKEIPVEILEAARMDGASHFQIFVSIVLPLSVPALTAMIKKYWDTRNEEESTVTSEESSKSQALLDIPMLEQYLELVGPKLITDGLAVFEKMMPGYLSVLESNLTARDKKGVVEEGHKIKGAAGSVGLRHLQQLGQQIQSPDLPAWEDNVAEWIEEMKQEWQHDVAVLKAWVASVEKK